MALDIDFKDAYMYQLPNWAEHLDAETLKKIGQDVVDDAKVDASSRSAWMDEMNMWLNMASQVMESKSTPWENASNVKFPLLTTAALQFHARAHQELLKGDKLVKGRVIGHDPDGQKAARKDRVSRAMSAQLLFQMEDWQDDTDRLLFILPLVGTVFRKVSWSNTLKRPSSELILPDELIVNFYATDWERARKVHSFGKPRNEVVELINSEVYSDIDLPMEADTPSAEEEPEDEEAPDEATQLSQPKDVPFTILEAHAWWDLDGDGYEEPYIVTVLHQTQEVLRIVPRFLPESIEWTDLDEKIKRIRPIEYITPYKFLPDVDSSIYGVGLGSLLGPTNAAIDTIINQLVDSGTLATMPSGFFGRGIRLSRGGRIRLAPGQWEMVNSTGEDLKKNFFPIPAKEPSTTLFQLLGLLIQAGEKMGSVTEALSGENPGQNQPFRTTSAVMEQGMQVYRGIHKRIYRALTHEFRSLYTLNYIHLGEDQYSMLLDDPQGAPNPQQDFQSAGLDVLPEADPSLENSERKHRRVSALIEARNAGMPLDDMHIAKLFLEALDEPHPDQALRQTPPPPTAEQVKQEQFEKEMEFKKQELMLNAQWRQYESALDLAKAFESMMKAKSLGMDGEAKQMEAQIEMLLKKQEAAMKQQDFAQKFALGEQKRQIEREKADSQQSGTGGSS